MRIGVSPEKILEEIVMSDFEQTNEKKGFQRFMQSPFFTLSKPYLDYIGKGTMFNLVYVIMAVVSLLVIPIGVLIWVIETEILRWFGGRAVVWFIFTMLFVLLAGWIGFQLWMNRMSQVRQVKDSEFVVIPILADIIRTTGEWLGTLLAIIGFGAGLFGLIIYNELIADFIPGGGIVLLLAGPVLGFFVVLLHSAIAEGVRIFVSIANSLKEISQKK
jgi:hypothetical protein